jgi:hypothetical protein
MSDKVIQVIYPGGPTIYFTPEKYKEFQETCKAFEKMENEWWYGEYKPKLNETHKNTELE